MSIKAETSFSLKDQLFNKETLKVLALSIKDVDSDFKHLKYQKEVLARFPDLELKERIDFMATLLESYLPSDYKRAIAILLAALPEPLDPELGDDDFGQFIWSVPAEFAAKFGCNKVNLDDSLRFLRESTKRFSVEFSIRPFLKQFEKPTLKFLKSCAKDKNYHVRRLASEGSRPLLPWALRVTPPLADVIEMLDLLHTDSTRYVTRSVANHLNDLSKSEPKLVLTTLARWRQAAAQDHDELA